MTVEENLRATETLDKALNERNWDLFNERHADDVVSYSPFAAEPTKGIDPHRQLMKGLIEAFPDFRMEPERSFGQGEWVSAEYIMTGTHKGLLIRPDGTKIPPTNKSVRIPVSSTMRFKDGRVVEEHIYWDRLAMTEQLGLVP
jgi:steroid delta-isomerase-like uncharacterized protein